MNVQILQITLQAIKALYKTSDNYFITTSDRKSYGYGPAMGQELDDEYARFQPIDKNVTFDAWLEANINNIKTVTLEGIPEQERLDRLLEMSGQEMMDDDDTNELISGRKHYILNVCDSYLTIEFITCDGDDFVIGEGLLALN